MCSRYCTMKTGQHCTQVVGCDVTVSHIAHAKCVNLHETNWSGKDRLRKADLQSLQAHIVQYRVLAIMFFCQSSKNNELEGVVLWMINHVLCKFKDGSVNFPLLVPKVEHRYG